MKQKLTNTGFGAVEVLVIVAIVLGLGLGSWTVLHKDKKDQVSPIPTKTSSQSAKQPNTQTDLSEGGKYLVIKGWGVRTALPADFQGKVTYTIKDDTDPDTGLPLESADIFVRSDAFNADICSITNTSVGPSISAGTFYLRSDNAKPFNAARYKQPFTANILTDDTYSYHISNIVPDCLGGGANAAKLQELQTALTDLAKV